MKIGKINIFIAKLKGVKSGVNTYPRMNCIKKIQKDPRENTSTVFMKYLFWLGLNKVKRLMANKKPLRQAIKREPGMRRTEY